MDNLQDNLNKVKTNESFLERIKRFIPGYDGYVNRDNSRELDTILRNQLALKLEQNKIRIKNAVTALTRNGKLFESSDVDKIDKKNETAIAKLKSAARGYSGMFDVVKIKEDKLNMLYQFDSALITLVEETNTLFGELETNSNTNTDIKDSVFKISYSLDNLLLKFDERENLLRAFN